MDKMQKTNEEIYEQAARLLAGEMDTQEKLTWTGNLDPKDNQLLDRIKNDWKMIEHSNTHNNSTNDAWKKLYQRFETDNLLPEAKGRTRALRFTMALKIAATLLLLLIVPATYLAIRSLKAPTAIAINTLHTDTQKTVILPDGSVVYLNSNSGIRYPQQFLPTAREVILEGEAFFEIKPNPQSPFTVTVKKTKITVLGTSFNIQAGGKEDAVEVNVKTGKVKMSSTLVREQSVILLPGEKGAIANHQIVKTIHNNDNYLAWKTKVLCFDGEKLKDGIAAINHAYHTEILISNKVPDNNTFSKIEFNDLPLDTILELLCATFNLRAEKQGNQITLFQK